MLPPELLILPQIMLELTTLTLCIFLKLPPCIYMTTHGTNTYGLFCSYKYIFTFIVYNFLLLKTKLDQHNRGPQNYYSQHGTQNKG